MFRNAALVLFVLALLISTEAMAQRRRKAAPLPPAVSVPPIDEPIVIQRLLEAYLLAESDFFATPDVAAAMRFYSLDYVEISNGKSRTRQEVEQRLAQNREKLQLGSPLRRAIRGWNFDIRMYGPALSVSTFNFSDKLGRQGVEQLSQEGICTEVLRKSAGHWLIEHEHCSMVP